MLSNNTKTLLYVAWALTVCVVAFALGITSVPNLLVMACVAVVPPLLLRRFWQAPEQTISESINDARR
jgi:hypothetical protein